jgi:hypothetical protein
MTQVSLSNGRLTVRLRTWERVAGLLGDLDLPLTSVESADAVVDGTRALTGVRAPGWPGPAVLASAPGAAAAPPAGSRCGPDGRRCACCCGASATTRILVTTPDAEALAGDLRAQAG